MLNALLRTTLAGLLAGFALLSFAQNVTITYVKPPDLTVCDTAQFEVTVANALAGLHFFRKTCGGHAGRGELCCRYYQ